MKSLLCDLSSALGPYCVFAQVIGFLKYGHNSTIVDAYCMQETSMYCFCVSD